MAIDRDTYPEDHSLVSAHRTASSGWQTGVLQRIRRHDDGSWSGLIGWADSLHTGVEASWVDGADIEGAPELRSPLPGQRTPREAR